jgi:Mitochondrial ribosomal protein S25
MTSQISLRFSVADIIYPCRDLRQRERSLSCVLTCLVLSPMVRRIASQVHKQASRLIRAGFIKSEPAWYQAVLDHPPLPLPPREPPSRTSYDSKPPKLAFAAAAKKPPGPPRPPPVCYIEDGIRRQFFRDHPFESFRPRTLTEAGTIEEEHPVRGVRWTRLRQRGHNPSPEECVHPISIFLSLYFILLLTIYAAHTYKPVHDDDNDGDDDDDDTVRYNSP